MDTELWVYFHQYVYMVWHYFHFQNVYRKICSILKE